MLSELPDDGRRADGMGLTFFVESTQLLSLAEVVHEIDEIVHLIIQKLQAWR